MEPKRVSLTARRGTNHRWAIGVGIQNAPLGREKVPKNLRRKVLMFNLDLRCSPPLTNMGQDLASPTVDKGLEARDGHFSTKATKETVGVKSLCASEHFLHVSCLATGPHGEHWTWRWQQLLKLILGHAQQLSGPMAEANSPGDEAEKFHDLLPVYAMTSVGPLGLRIPVAALPIAKRTLGKADGFRYRTNAHDRTITHATDSRFAPRTLQYIAFDEIYRCSS